MTDSIKQAIWQVLQMNITDEEKLGGVMDELLLTDEERILADECGSNCSQVFSFSSETCFNCRLEKREKAQLAKAEKYYQEVINERSQTMLNHLNNSNHSVHIPARQDERALTYKDLDEMSLVRSHNHKQGIKIGVACPRCTFDELVRIQLESGKPE